MKKLALTLIISLLFISTAAGMDFTVNVKDQSGIYTAQDEICVSKDSFESCKNGKSQAKFTLPETGTYSIQTHDRAYSDETVSTYVWKSGQSTTVFVEKTESSRDTSTDNDDDGDLTFNVKIKDQSGILTTVDQVCISKNSFESCKNGKSTMSFSVPSTGTYDVSITDNEYEDKTVSTYISQGGQTTTFNVRKASTGGDGSTSQLGLTLEVRTQDGILTTVDQVCLSKNSYQQCKTGKSRMQFSVPGKGTYSAQITDQQYRDKTVSTYVWKDGQTTKLYVNRRTTDTNSRPVAALDVRPNSAKTGETITFDATGSYDSDGYIQRYRFDLNNDGNYEVTDYDGVIRRSFSSPRSTTATVKVYDNNEAARTDSESYSVTRRTTATGVAQVTDADPSGSVNNPVRLGLTLDRSVGRGEYDCYWSRNSYVSRSDNAMSKSGSKNFRDSERFSSGSKTVWMACFRNSDGEKTNTRSTTFTVSEAQNEGTLDVDVEDTNDNPLKNARVEIENGEHHVLFTSSSGKIQKSLTPGEYRVIVSKSGYRSQEKSVYIDSRESEVLRFRLRDRDDDHDDDEFEDIEITSTDYPSSVCRGSSLAVTTTIRNNGNSDELVTLTGKGLGSVKVTNSFVIEEEESVRRTVRFTNVRGSGTEQFTMTATNSDSDSSTRTVNVRSCDLPPITADGPDGVSLELSPKKVRMGQTVKVSGFVDGLDRRAPVSIRINGRTAARVNTQPDGYYQAFITPDSIGTKTVTANVDGLSSSRELEVLPTVNVLFAESPQKVFEGESFEVCGKVESQTTPRVLLKKDGKIVDSKNQKGKVCFKRTAHGTGTHKYDVIALAQGAKNVATTMTEVLPTGSETESFPSKVASVESGSGMVKVDLYNTHHELKRYNVKLDGLPSTWVSQSEKEVILDTGERETVYFYLTPEEPGTFNAQLKVESDGSTVHSETVEVSSGGTDEPQRKSFVDSLKAIFGL